MDNELKKIESFLKESFQAYTPSLKISSNKPGSMEAHGTIPTMQGRQKVDGFYFGSIVPKPKDIRLYFFPIYTHPQAFEDISEGLRKCLKGKSCFHIKKMDDTLKEDISRMIKTGIETYKKEGILTK